MGQARSRASARRAQASSRCSQLSSTSSRCLGRRASARVASNGRPGSSRTPRAPATAWGTSAGSGSAARSTSHTPSAYAGRTSAATWSASARLAHAAGAGQRHQPVRGDQRRDRGELVLAPDEAGQLQRQVGGPARRAAARPRRGRRPQLRPLTRPEVERRRQGVEGGGVGPGVACLQALQPPPAQPGPLGQRLLGQPGGARWPRSSAPNAAAGAPSAPPAPSVIGRPPPPRARPV